MVKNEKIEDEIETEVRRRIRGKHVEIASITLEGVDYAPEIASAVRQKLVAEQDAFRQKAAIAADALRKRTQIETDAQATRLKLDAEAQGEKQQSEIELLKRRNSRAEAEEQVAVEKAEAEARLIKARAESQEMTVRAQGEIAQHRAEATAVTPLAVQQSAYEALGNLAGKGTTVYLGDFSHVPSFLFAKGGALGGYTLGPVAPPTANFGK